MENGIPRNQRRLGKGPLGDAPQEREIISLDSSSDEFVPSSGEERSGSEDDEEGTSHGLDSQPLATKKRGFKRLRRSGDDEIDRETTHNAKPPIATTTANTAASQESQEPVALEWECARCTFINEPQRLACELCLSVRAPVPVKSTRKIASWLTKAAAPKEPKQPTRARAKRTSIAAASSMVAADETIDSGDDDFASESESDATRQRNKKPAITTTTTNTSSSSLWSESWTADQMDELCVQKKKMQEVHEWLLAAAAASRTTPSPPPPHGFATSKRLLFVCGPPGSGKSTTVRQLAQQMAVSVKEWRDNSSAGRLQYHRYLSDDFQMTHVSPWDDFVDFINRSVNYSALPVASSARSDHARSKKRPLAVSSTASQQQATGQLVLLESWPTNPQSNSNSQDSNLWDEKLKQAFRQIVNPAANLQYPVVCIFSDVRDKKMDATQLAKLFSDDVVRSPYTSVINFNPVTAAQLKKTLTRMLDKQEGRLSPQDLAKIIDKSNGDIRHAINMVQLMQKKKQQGKGIKATPWSISSNQPARGKTASSASQTTNTSKEDEQNNEDDDEDELSRDPFYSDFHIVGKLLHSKNKQTTQKDGNEDHAPTGRLLAFDRILDSSAMALDRVLSLLHSNCPAYFTEIEDLDQAVDLMSLSESWLHGSYRNASGSAAFKTSHDLVRAVVVRSIALTNAHPAPSAFRPITAPRTYETTKRMVASRRDALLLQQQDTGNQDFSYAYICRGDVYAFEMQPFVDVLQRTKQQQQPVSHGHAVGQLHHHDLAGESDQQVSLDDDIESSDGDGW